MPRNRAPGHFDRHDWGRSLQKGNDQHAHHVEECVFLVGSLGHVGGDGANQSVAKQNSQESTDEGSGDFMPDFLRRATQSAHSDDNPEDGRDDSQSRQGVGPCSARSLVGLRHGGGLPYRARASDPARRRRIR